MWLQDLHLRLHVTQARPAEMEDFVAWQEQVAEVQVRGWQAELRYGRCMLKDAAAGQHAAGGGRAEGSPGLSFSQRLIGRRVDGWRGNMRPARQPQEARSAALSWLRHRLRRKRCCGVLLRWMSAMTCCCFMG